MCYEVCRRPVTTKAPVCFQVSSCEICGGQRRLVTALLRVVLLRVFFLSILFHQCSTFLFTYMLPLPQGQVSKAWKASKKAMVFRKSWGIGNKTTHFHVYIYKCNVHSAHTVHICVVRKTQNKQKLFLCTRLTCWFFLTERD